MRYTRFLLLLFLFLLSRQLVAQNLFPNPGFELYDQCPNSQTQIRYCADWDSAYGTADFYHCGFYLPTSVGTYGIPQTGNGVLGFACAAPDVNAPAIRFYGECIQATLGEELKPGAQYKIEMNLLFNSVNMPRPTPGCFDMGFYFFKSGNPPAFTVNDCQPFKPHLRIPAADALTNNYKTFNWTWTADSCYDRVLIGLFCNDSTFGFYCTTHSSSVYYFDLDNVSMNKIADSPSLSFGFSSDKIEACINDCISFKDTSSSNINTHEWIFEGGSPSASSMVNPQNICYYDAGTFDVTFVVHYECGSDTIIKKDFIKINASPYLDLRADSMPQCYGVPVNLSANSNAQVTWNDRLIADSRTVISDGLFTAIAENNCGSAYDTLEVYFEKCICPVFLPDAFTPNGDLMNDYYKAVLNCQPLSFSMSIWNRWGQQIFNSSDPGTMWDGNYNGSPCPEGVYALLLEYRAYNEEKSENVIKRKNIVLIR